MLESAGKYVYSENSHLSDCVLGCSQHCRMLSLIRRRSYTAVSADHSDVLEEYRHVLRLLLLRPEDLMFSEAGADHLEW
jgi:hypothetical protein